jgi:hypothetical protein
MKIEGHPNLIKDENSNAILNTNNSEYENYIQSRAKRKQGTNRIDNIKSLLRALSNG